MHRIVVGVDGSEGSDEALRWALRCATETRATVEAVNAWELSYEWVDGYFPHIERWCQEASRSARVILDAAVDRAVAGQAGSVGVSRTVVEGPAARVLIEEAKGADLLVVGSRGRGGFVGLLLGSVSEQCVQHACCPVVVVPTPA